MARWRRTLAAACVVVAVTATAVACGDDDDAATTDEAAASLTVYSGRDEELVAPLFERFTDETGIAVEVRYGDTAEMAATIVEEGDRSPADVFFGQDGGALGALEKEGRFAELSEDTLEPVVEAFRSPDGRWIGTSGRVRVLAYDTRELQPADLPASIFDLTGPDWKGKVGWVPGNASFQAFVTAMRASEGEERTEQWLRDMESNGAVAYERNGALRDAIANGEIVAGLTNHYYAAQAKAELAAGEEFPVDNHVFPDGDVGSLVNVAGAGVVNTSDSPAEAEQLVAYLAAPDAQEFFVEETKEYPVVAGVPGPEGLPALDEIEVPAVNLNDLEDLRGTLALIEKVGLL